MDSIEAVKDWLVNSGIQNSSGENAGGFNAWYDFEKEHYSYIYSEITGYGITTLMYMYDRFSDAIYLKKAEEAFLWLKNKAMSPFGGVRTRDYYLESKESDKYSFESDNLYAFDNGMVLYGIANLYRVTKNKEHLIFAEKIAKFMIEKMRKDDGLFYAVYSGKTGAKEDAPWKWSTQSGSYHAKLALGLIDLYEETKNEEYLNVARDLSLASLSFQAEDGRFITSREDRSTHLHPHSYSAEGLLYAGCYFEDDRLIRSAQNATTWALEAQTMEGIIPKFFIKDEFSSYFRTDVLAQVLRLGAILYSLKLLPEEYLKKLDLLRKKLVEVQYNGKNNQLGGFIFGYTLDGKKKEHVNSWCSMFALQALKMYKDYCIDKNEFNGLRCLI